MSKKILEMKNERAKLISSMREMLDACPGVMPADKIEQYEKMESDIETMSNRIDVEQKQLDREQMLGEKVAEAKDARRDAKPEIKDAFNRVLKMWTPENLSMYNALQQDDPTQAGYLVPPQDFRDQLIAELDAATFMRQQANVLPPLTSAQSLGIPTRTDNMATFGWGTEISTPSEDSTLAYGKREFVPSPAGIYIKVSNKLLRTLPKVDSYVRQQMSAAGAVGMETAYMTGSGAGQPLGLFTASDDGIGTARDVSTGNTATDIKFDNLIEVQEKVEPQYQNGCGWIFHSDAVKKIRKLKDSDGQYIWQPSMQLGQPDMLLGKPVQRSAYAPNTFTTGLYVGLYGDLKYYMIADSLLLEISVLKELYALTGQTGYIARIETDGAPVLAKAFARVKLG
jgi:HK97 family phage major capsid protein